MKIPSLNTYQSISEFSPPKQTIVTLGTFDGVHTGHRKIISKLVQSAAETGLESALLTFFPHPRMVLAAESNIQLLNTIDERAQLLEQIGLQNLIVHPFDKKFSMLGAEEFVKDILVDGLNIHKIIIGHDHRFGQNRTAGIEELITFGKQYNFEVEQISASEIDDVAVSSTKIRNALLEGNVALANEFLGYAYFLTGTVIEGKKLGRTIGFPTANLKISADYKLIPAKGVYVVKANLHQREVFGMMNIGTNPTVDGSALSIETYFFDFDSDLYGQQIQISILERIRNEYKFASIDVLKQQLHRDQEFSLRYLNNQQ